MLAHMGQSSCQYPLRFSENAVPLGWQLLENKRPRSSELLLGIACTIVSIINKLPSVEKVDQPPSQLLHLPQKSKQGSFKQRKGRKGSLPGRAEKLDAENKEGEKCNELCSQRA